VERHGVANRLFVSELLKVIRKTFQPFAPFQTKFFAVQNLLFEVFMLAMNYGGSNKGGASRSLFLSVLNLNNLK